MTHPIPDAALNAHIAVIGPGDLQASEDLF